MYCAKCGAKIADNASFCGKCGQPVSVSSAKDSSVEKKIEKPKTSLPGAEQIRELASKYLRKWSWWKSADWKEPGKSVWLGGHLLVLIVIAVIAASGSRRDAIKSTSAEAASYSDAETITVSSLSLDGAYPKLKSVIILGGDLYLSGDFPKLENIVMRADSEGRIGDFMVGEGTVFPALSSFTGASIVSRAGIICDIGFEINAFPALERANISTINAYYDEKFAETCELLDSMDLRVFNMEVSHTIEDLYGTWADESGGLSIEIQENGTMVIYDNVGMLTLSTGKFSYTEAGSDTLKLSADINVSITPGVGLNLGEMLSINMEYALLGDRMVAEIMGKELFLTRKK